MECAVVCRVGSREKMLPLKDLFIDMDSLSQCLRNRAQLYDIDWGLILENVWMPKTSGRNLSDVFIAFGNTDIITGDTQSSDHRSYIELWAVALPQAMYPRMICRPLKSIRGEMFQIKT